MAEVCPGCNKSFRNLKNHLAQSSRCPTALEFQAQPPEPEPVREQPEEAPPIAPPAGLTVAEVGTIVAEAIRQAMTQITETINNSLAAERQNTEQKFAEVGPVVLKYLQAANAKEQAQAQQTANPSGGQPPTQGGDGLTQLANILGMFVKPAGGGLEQIAETIGSIGKLADAMDSLRYRPWRDGVDFATQNILQRTRMPGGPTPEEAAADLQKSMQGQNTFSRPSLPGEGKP